MFFNRHIKQGEEAGKICLGLIARCFKEVDVSENPSRHNFSIPKGFFADYYIIGFFAAYIGYLMDWGFYGSDWSPKRKHEFLCTAMNELDSTESLFNNFMSLSTPEGQKMLHSEEYGKGFNDGVAVIGSAYGKLVPTGDDPLDVEAESLAKKVHKNTAFLGAIDAEHDSKNGALSTAYIILTIMKHVQENWANE